MSEQTQSKFENDILTVTRVYNASKANVFDAWMNTEKMDQWYGPKGVVGIKSIIEAQAGGLYAHEMTFEGGKVHKSTGILTEYDPPNSFAYQSPGASPEETMTIRVEFIEQGTATLVRLTHAGVSEKMAQFVSPAWSAAFEKLVTFLQK